jgi:hypothetical protein
MRAMPGESIISRHVPGGWEDGTQAEASLTAAAYHTCRWLLPVDAWEPGVHRYIIAMDGAIPALLEISVHLPLGQCELSLRISTGADKVGMALVEQIRELALKLAPAREDGSRTAQVRVADELPF